MDASEQGLAFHAANAVQQSGPIRLSISPNPTQRLELIAEIVWMDDARKFGGLRFTEVTARARNGIRQWLAETAESRTPDVNLAVPPCAPKDETDPWPVVARTADLPRVISSLDGAKRPLAAPATLAVSRFSSIPPISHLSEPFSQENQTSAIAPLVRGRGIRWISHGNRSPRW